MPARCWIAPEMPAATYSCGETCLPVWPTWLLCGYQPASTAAREAPDGRAERVGERLDGAEVAVRAAAAGDDDRRLGQVGAPALGLRLALDDPDAAWRRR